MTFSDGQPTWNSGRVWREPPERQRHLKFGRRGREGRRHIQRDPGRDAWNHLGMSGVDPGSKSALRSAQILMRSGKSVPDCAASSEPHGSRTKAAYSVDDIVQQYCVSKGTVFGLLRHGILQRVKIGRRTVVPVASVLAWWESVQKAS